MVAWSLCGTGKSVTKVKYSMSFAMATEQENFSSNSILLLAYLINEGNHEWWLYYTIYYTLWGVYEA